MALDYGDEILLERDQRTDALVSNYAANLSEIELHAALGALNKLHGILTTGPNGAIERTPGNLRVLRSLDTLLIQQMEDAGLTRTITAFTDQWFNQVEYVQRLWRAMTETMQEPLPALKFSSQQKAAFVAEQLSAMDQLRDNVVAAAIRVKSVANMTVGGLRFNAISDAMRDQFKVSLAQSKTLADTLITNFFRSVNAASFEAIQAETPKQPLRYRYSQVPDDAKTRPFCHRMIRETRERGFTHADIDVLDNNNALSNVWLACGGFSCRHIWLLDTSALEAAFKARKQMMAAVA